MVRGSVHLSASLAWAWRGPQRHDRLDSIRGGPDRRGRQSVVGPWPWLFAVNDRSARLPSPLPGVRCRGHQSGARFDEQCDLERSHLRPVDQRHRRSRPWRARWAGAELCIAIVFAFVLVTRQLSQSSPMLPVDLLRIPLFRMSVATSICSFLAQNMALVSLPFLFENTLGRSQVETGLLLTPWPLAVAVIAPFTGRLSDRYPAGLLGGCGSRRDGHRPCIARPAAGASDSNRHCLAHADLRHRVRLLQHAEQRAIITSAPPTRAGAASGMQATSRLLGQSMGAATVALIFGLAPGAWHNDNAGGRRMCRAGAPVVSFLRMVERGRGRNSSFASLGVGHAVITITLSNDPARPIVPSG